MPVHVIVVPDSRDFYIAGNAVATELISRVEMKYIAARQRYADISRGNGNREVCSSMPYVIAVASSIGPEVPGAAGHSEELCAGFGDAWSSTT